MYLPRNMNQQFRDVQAGIEHLKDSAETIITELKLKASTTDIKEIIQKVNTIDASLKKHIKTANSNFKSIKKGNEAVYELMQAFYKAVDKQSESIFILQEEIKKLKS